MRQFIIDTDPGVDDAQAIMLANAYPGVAIKAVTAVAGNIGLEKTVTNSCKILDFLGEDAPIFAGCDSALVEAANHSAHVHGNDGLGDAGFAPSRRPVEREHAALALIRLALESPGELTLVALGPLTNLAVALKLSPDLPSLYKRLVIMGGAVDMRGNTPNFVSEFNIAADPEAAFIVFSSWPEFDLISWEASVAHGITIDTLRTWRDGNSPRANFFWRFSEKTIHFIEIALNLPLLPIADGLAMAVALEPQLVLEAEKRFVTVELHGRYSRGQTVVDWSGQSAHKPNANIIRLVDQQRFQELMEDALCGG